MEFENKKLRSVAEAAARIMMGEKALHPNQQKLDVHEPEKDKLTSDDFKKLRTMKKEETMHEESCDCGDCPSDKDMKKEEVDLDEMDKGGYRATRDDDDNDYTKGKWIKAKPMLAKDATSSAFKQLNKAFNKDPEKKDMKKEEVGLEEARSINLKAGKVGNEVHMSKWMQDHTKKNKSTGSSDAWNEYHGKGTVTHLGKDGHVKVKSHDTGMTHKFDYYGKGVGRDSEDMSVHGSKDDIHSLRNVKEEVDLEEGKMGQLSADLKDLSHDDFHKEYGKPKSHYDPSNFKKPVQPGKEMDRAKSLAQRAMASMKKEEVEQIDELTGKGKLPAIAAYHKEKSAEAKDKMEKVRATNTKLPVPKSTSAKIFAKDYESKYHSTQAKRAAALMKKEEVEELEEMFPGTPEYEKKYGKAPQDMKKGEKKKTTQGEMEKTGKGVVHRRKFSEMVESYTEGGVKGLFKTLAEEPTSAEFDAQLDDAKKRAAGTKKQPEVSKPAVQAVQNEEVELTLEDFTPEELEEFMQTEEYEQLDELSKETLGSYVKKSVKDVNTKSRHAQHYKSMFADQFPVRGAKKEVANKQEKINKRVTGIGKAVDRLTKEGVEQVEEQTHTTVSFIDYNDVNGVKYAEIDLSKKD